MWKSRSPCPVEGIAALEAEELSTSERANPDCIGHPADPLDQLLTAGKTTRVGMYGANAAPVGPELLLSRFRQTGRPATALSDANLQEKTAMQKPI